MDTRIVERIFQRAGQADARIVLPESSDPRVIRAARIIRDRNLARLVLLGEPDGIRRLAQAEGVDLSDIEILDPGTDRRRAEYVQTLHERRKAKGMTRRDADKLLSNPVYYAGMMTGAREVDGMVAGSVCTTRDTVRSALYGAGTAPGCKTVSGGSIMMTIVPEAGVNGALIFADTGVVPEPTGEQLADIAAGAGSLCRTLLEAEPRIAMLSFSTKGSAHSAAVQKVIDATAILKRRHPDLKVDGELQLDAAIVPSVARRKAEGSSVAGRANTLVFPDLSSGNIGYKLVERLGNAKAIGPLLQGLARPINDLSRGCDVEAIALSVAITAVQASSTNAT